MAARMAAKILKGAGSRVPCQVLAIGALSGLQKAP